MTILSTETLKDVDAVKRAIEEIKTEIAALEMRIDEGTLTEVADQLEKGDVKEGFIKCSNICGQCCVCSIC